jgi:hypothetical protein
MHEEYPALYVDYMDGFIRQEWELQHKNLDSSAVTKDVRCLITFQFFNDTDKTQTVIQSSYNSILKARRRQEEVHQCDPR